MKRDVVILACAISAGIHAALAPEHFEEGVGAGLGFAASAVVLAALVVALTRRPTSVAPVALAALAFAGLLAAWVLAVTTGFPVLHPEPEAVDGLAVATKAIEIAGALAALSVVRAEAQPQPQPRGSLT